MWLIVWMKNGKKRKHCGMRVFGIRMRKTAGTELEVKPQKALAEECRGLVMYRKDMKNLIVILPVLWYYLTCKRKI